MLEMLGVPYVGSGPMAHGLALDKVIAKIMFTNNGLPTPGFRNFASPDDHFEDLVFPVIVKPKMEAVSYGIRVVDNWDDLREAVATIVNEFQQHVLVEQFVSGREFAIGLLGNGDPEVLPITEIDLRGDPDAIQTSEEKLRNPLDKLCPAPLSDELRGELEQLSRRAFQALDLKDFARVDLRMDAKERPYILEINSMASLGRTGTYVHSAQVAGYTYESLINKMLDVAAVRYFGLDYEESARASEAMRSGRGRRERLGTDSDVPARRDDDDRGRTPAARERAHPHRRGGSDRGAGHVARRPVPPDRLLRPRYPSRQCRERSLLEEPRWRH